MAEFTKIPNSSKIVCSLYQISHIVYVKNCSVIASKCESAQDHPIFLHLKDLCWFSTQKIWEFATSLKSDSIGSVG